MGDEHLAEHLGGDVTRFFRRLADMHAAFEPVLEGPLAAPTGMDLRLDDDLRTAEAPGHGESFIGGERDVSLGTGDAEFLEEFARLVFVNVHDEEEKTATAGAFCLVDVDARLQAVRQDFSGHRSPDAAVLSGP